MSAILRILENLIEITLYDIERIEIWCRERRGRKFRPAAGRFSGFFYIDPRTGVPIVATQVLQPGVPSTAPLIFTDAAGNTGAGPIGVVSPSDPTVSVALSADGQACNVTLPATPLSIPVTLTWHDPAGVVPDFTVDVSDVAPPFQATQGAFGTFVAGTTP